ncbi:S8 family serine peptidase [Inquilinus limosus]|uniref:S8 family peptidase n=1 Tax=Inquilinus limosus TaxID=171674 RepID=UPI003F137344
MAMTKTPSRQHVDAYLARERRDLERLRASVGSEVVAKLDPVLRRDLLARRREVEFEALFAELPSSVAETPVRAPPSRGVAIITPRGARIPERLRPMRLQDMRIRRRALASVQQRAQRLMASLAEDVARRDGEVLDQLWLVQSVVARLDEDAMVEIAARNDVAALANNKDQIVLDLDVSRPLIRADQVEAAGIDGLRVQVGVLDTGVDTSLAALAGVVATQSDFTGEGTGDLNGHGTHCAGVIASQDATFRGIAPGATIHDFKLMNSLGGSTPSIATSTIAAAVAAGMDVLSNSWGWSHANGQWADSNGTCVLCTAANNAVALGCAFVVAAGNDGDDSCSSYDTRINCPGMAASVITVGASDDADAMASFSSYGPTPDGRSKPEVVAPGVDIASCRSSTGNEMNGGASPIDANWTKASGTSQATPHIAGVCALMLHKNRDLAPAAIREILMATAVDIGADPNAMGAGRVDALAAVNAS